MRGSPASPLRYSLCKHQWFIVHQFNNLASYLHYSFLHLCLNVFDILLARRKTSSFMLPIDSNFEYYSCTVSEMTIFLIVAPPSESVLFEIKIPYVAPPSVCSITILSTCHSREVGQRKQRGPQSIRGVCVEWEAIVQRCLFHDFRAT